MGNPPILNRKSVTTVIHTFEPISNKNSRVLILGTMPSVQSRMAEFYYSHPRNRFWVVLAKCLKQQLPQSVNDKVRLLQDNNIALWDVLATCEIIGSDDSTIRKPVCNDIASFVKGRPITKVLCNGKKAYGLCLQLNLSTPIVCLPSTSPANAAWGLEQLIVAWKKELITA